MNHNPLKSLDLFYARPLVEHNNDGSNGPLPVRRNQNMAEIHQPHYRLFRSVFSDAGEAAGLLQTALPATLRNSFDWTTLILVDGTFIDEERQGSQSDLLYQVEHTESGQAVSVYMLFEHQSSPGPWMPFRLLRYCCRIWETVRTGLAWDVIEATTGLTEVGFQALKAQMAGSGS